MKTKEDNPTLYFSFLTHHAAALKEKGKGIVYVGNTFFFGVVGKENAFDITELKEIL